MSSCHGALVFVVGGFTFLMATIGALLGPGWLLLLEERELLKDAGGMFMS